MANNKREIEKWQKLAVQVSAQAARENCEFFIENFVHIEDKDAADIVAPFNLWDGQREALRAMIDNRLVVALKARQLGISWLSLAYACWLMLKPGRSVLALSKTEDDAKELVRRMIFMLRYMPPWFIQAGNMPNKNMMVYDSLQTSVTIFHPEGEPSVFKSFPAGQNSSAGFTANLVILDEWALQQYARDIWRAAFPTINRPAGGKLIGISTIRKGTLFEEIVQGALDGTNDFKLVFLPWNTDPRRDEKWLERTRRALDPEQFRQEYPATVEEALRDAEGSFFNEFSRAMHVRAPERPIPDFYRRYASIDYGLDMLAVHWYYADSSGQIRIYRELYQKDLIVSEAARAIKKAMGGEKLAAFFAPPDLWNRNRDTGKSTAVLFAEQGLYLTRTDNRREQGWVAVKELLRPKPIRNPHTGKEEELPTLTFDEGAAPNLERCLQKIQRDPHNANDVLDKSMVDHELTHAPDSLRCFAAGRLIPIQHEVPTGRWQDQFEPVFEEEGDFITW